MAAYSGTAIDAAETNIDAHRVELAAALTTLQGLSQKNSQTKGQIEAIVTIVDNALDDVSTAIAALQTQIAAADFTP